MLYKMYQLFSLCQNLKYKTVYVKKDAFENKALFVKQLVVKESMEILDYIG